MMPFSNCTSYSSVFKPSNFQGLLAKFVGIVGALSKSLCEHNLNSENFNENLH